MLRLFFNGLLFNVLQNRNMRLVEYMLHTDNVCVCVTQILTPRSALTYLHSHTPFVLFKLDLLFLFRTQKYIICTMFRLVQMWQQHLDEQSINGNHVGNQRAKETPAIKRHHTFTRRTVPRNNIFFFQYRK